MSETDFSSLSDAGQAPYEGQPGATRSERVHLVQADGSVRSHQVYRGVNVASHPELKQRALSGALHTLADGRELALPFVYHDPDARKFALVLPPSLAHLELKAWAELMQEVAAETGRHVPAYVRDSTTVLGIAALELFLQQPEPSQQSGAAAPTAPADDGDQATRATLIEQRQRDLDEQEQNLIRMAEGLTAREGDINRREEQVSVARVDLEAREEDLSERLARGGLSHEAQVLPEEPVPRVGWQETGSARVAEEATVISTQPHPLPGGEAMRVLDDGTGEAVEDDELSEEVVDEELREDVPEGELREVNTTEPPPLHGSHRTAPPPLPGRPHAGPTPPPLNPQRAKTDDALTVVTSSAGQVLNAPDPAPQARSADEPTPEVSPPEHFWAMRPGQLTFRIEDDQLRLFVHADSAHSVAFETGPDLMIQYVEVADYPVVVLTLIDSVGDKPYVARLLLDGRTGGDRDVVELLERSYRARVSVYVDQHYRDTITVSVLREGVARLILDKLSKVPDHMSISAGRAIKHVQTAPPPIANDDLPFGPARRDTATAVTVMAAVEQLSTWMRPEKLEAAQLIYSVPEHVVDASVRRVLRAALTFGVALPENLRALALQHGLAKDGTEMVSSQLGAFSEVVQAGGNDMGQDTTVLNWQQLFDQARRDGVAVDEHFKQLADGAVGAAEHSSSAPERALSEFESAELKSLLQDANQRVAAIQELCLRGHPSVIGTIFRVLPGLPPAQMAASLPHLLSFGEQVGDELIRGLGSPSPELRQLCALGLGRLRLRRSVGQLIKQLDLERSEGWTEMARALGDFGLAALRPLTRAHGNSRNPERVVVALSHLANHGCAKDVENLENGGDPALANLARKAMARRSRLEWEDLAVRELRALAEDQPSARLAQAFYAEVLRVDI